MVERSTQKHGSKIERFEVEDVVSVFVPRKSRGSTDAKRIFCRVVRVVHGNRYQLQCRYGIIERYYPTRELERIPQALIAQIELPTTKYLPKRRVALAMASKLSTQSNQTVNLV